MATFRQVWSQWSIPTWAYVIRGKVVGAVVILWVGRRIALTRNDVQTDQPITQNAKRSRHWKILFFAETRFPLFSYHLFAIMKLPSKGWFTQAAFNACGCGRLMRYGKLEKFLIFCTTTFHCSRMCQMQRVWIILNIGLNVGAKLHCRFVAKVMC